MWIYCIVLFFILKGIFALTCPCTSIMTIQLSCIYLMMCCGWHGDIKTTLVIEMICISFCLCEQILINRNQNNKLCKLPPKNKNFNGTIFQGQRCCCSLDDARGPPVGMLENGCSHEYLCQQVSEVKIVCVCVHGGEGTCHPVQWCTLTMCYQLFLDKFGEEATQYWF